MIIKRKTINNGGLLEPWWLCLELTFPKLNCQELNTIELGSNKTFTSKTMKTTLGTAEFPCLGKVNSLSSLPQIQKIKNMYLLH